MLHVGGFKLSLRNFDTRKSGNVMAVNYILQARVSRPTISVTFDSKAERDKDLYSL